MYLQQALKDGTAKGAIEGLSHSGDNYEKATWSVSKMEVVRSLENYMITFNSISVHS